MRVLFLLLLLLMSRYTCKQYGHIHALIDIECGCKDTVSSNRKLISRIARSRNALTKVLSTQTKIKPCRVSGEEMCHPPTSIFPMMSIDDKELYSHDKNILPTWE